jgi:hypothetical protein
MNQAVVTLDWMNLVEIRNYHMNEVCTYRVRSDHAIMWAARETYRSSAREVTV